jgi:hypothetical protein
VSPAGELPEGYLRVSREGCDAYVWNGAVRWVGSLFEAGVDLSEGWRSDTPTPPTVSGRGPVHVIAAPVAGPDGCAAWLVRRYRRGGFAAPLLGDLYLSAGRTRPRRELLASAVARERGVRTPAVVAGIVYRAPGLSRRLFYRAALVTELVPGVRSLSALLFGDDSGGVATPPRVAPGPTTEDANPPADARALALSQAGRLIRALATAGVEHVDLNAGNVLVAPDADEAWVVDLDRCRIFDRGRAASAAHMARRLERSLRKLGAARARSLTGAEWAILRSAWMERS